MGVLLKDSGKNMPSLKFQASVEHVMLVFSEGICTLLILELLLSNLVACIF